MGAPHFSCPRKVSFLFKALFFPFAKHGDYTRLYLTLYDSEPHILPNMIFLWGQEPHASLAKGLVHSRCSVNAGWMNNLPWSF